MRCTVIPFWSLAMVKLAAVGMHGKALGMEVTYDSHIGKHMMDIEMEVSPPSKPLPLLQNCFYKMLILLTTLFFLQKESLHDA